MAGPQHRKCDLAHLASVVAAFQDEIKQFVENKKKETIYKTIKPKYKIGDLVNVLLQVPLNALGKKQNTTNFRMGDYRLDKKKRKVLAVLCYAGTTSYRYLIEGLPNASYTEQELKQV